MHVQRRADPRLVVASSQDRQLVHRLWQGIFFEEEEELKASIDANDTAIGSLPTNEQANKGDDNDVDLAKMSEEGQEEGGCQESP
jgi:hypothetical protein